MEWNRKYGKRTQYAILKKRTPNAKLSSNKVIKGYKRYKEKKLHGRLKNGIVSRETIQLLDNGTHLMLLERKTLKK